MTTAPTPSFAMPAKAAPISPGPAIILTGSISIFAARPAPWTWPMTALAKTGSGRTCENAHATDRRQYVAQQLDAFAERLRRHQRQARDVSPGPGQPAHHAG